MKDSRKQRVIINDYVRTIGLYKEAASSVRPVPTCTSCRPAQQGTSGARDFPEPSSANPLWSLRDRAHPDAQMLLSAFTTQRQATKVNKGQSVFK